MIRKQMDRRLAGLALVAALLLPPVSASAAPGDLDPSFGTAGKVAENYGHGGETRDLAVGQDGSIALVVSNGGYWGVARLHSTGARDVRFENGILGWKSGRFADPRANESAEAIVVQPDGMIVVGGTTYPDDSADQSRRDFGLIRLRPDADYDGSFGVAGKVTTRLRHGVLRDIVLQPDGKIVAVGESLPPDGNSNIDVTVVRYLPDGSLDPEFGDGGVVMTPNPGADRANAVTLDGLGRIVVAGAAGSEKYFAVSRYLPNGQLDATFGGGRVQFARGDLNGLNGVAVQQDGRIIAAGYRTVPDEAYDVEPTVLRLTALGVPDPTFGEGGEALIPVRGRQVLRDVGLQPDGKIVAVGGSETPTAAYLDWQKRDFGVYRLETTGRLDPTFAMNGIQRTDWYGELDDANALALGSDGRITVGGYVPRVDAAVARYLGDPASRRPDDPTPLPEQPTPLPDPPGTDPGASPAPSEGAQEPAPPVDSSVPGPEGAPPPSAPAPDGHLNPASAFPTPAVEMVRLRLTKRGVAVTLRCVSSSPCRGRMSVKHRRTKVGTTRFQLRAGTAKRLTMRITSRRLRQLRRRDRVRLVARVDLSGAKPRQWGSSVAR